MGLSVGTYRVSGNVVSADIALARNELALGVDGLDQNKNGLIEESDLVAGRDLLERSIVGRIRVSNGAGPCPGKLDTAELAKEDGVEMRAHFSCSESSGALSIDVDFVDDLPAGHRHVAHLEGGVAPVDEVLYRGKKHLGVEAAPSRDADAVDAVPTTKSAWLVAGLERTLFRYESLALVAALLIGRQRQREAMESVATFAAAASIALVVATLVPFAPAFEVTRPAIAITLVYIGLDNLVSSGGRGRAWVAASFGLVHGFGFAQALGSSAPSAPTSAGAVLAFGAGSSLAILVCGASAGAIVELARKRPLLENKGFPAVSLAIAALGLFLLVRGFTHRAG